MIVSGWAVWEPAAGRVSWFQLSWNLRYSSSHYPFTGVFYRSILNSRELRTYVACIRLSVDGHATFLRRYSPCILISRRSNLQLLPRRNNGNKVYGNVHHKTMRQLAKSTTSTFLPMDYQFFFCLPLLDRKPTSFTSKTFFVIYDNMCNKMIRKIIAACVHSSKTLKRLTL